MQQLQLADQFGRVARDLRVSLTDPLQPPMLLLHARRGPGLVAR